MPCHAAMIARPPCVKTTQVVKEVLELMQKKNVPFVPVIDEEQKLVGLFSYQILLKSLLPVSVSMPGGGSMDLTIRAAPGIAKRLKKVEPLPVGELMQHKFGAVYPETPTWEGINYLVQYGDPLMVIDQESGKLLGVMTQQAALEELHRLKGE